MELPPLHKIADVLAGALEQPACACRIRHTVCRIALKITDRKRYCHTVLIKSIRSDILENSKYKGSSLVHTSYISPGDEDHGVITEDEKGNRHVLIGVSDDHPPIVSTDIFEDVQKMRVDRSNIDHDSEGKKFRKSTHYSSKRAKPEKKGEPV